MLIVIVLDINLFIYIFIYFRIFFLFLLFQNMVYINICNNNLLLLYLFNIFIINI